MASACSAHGDGDVHNRDHRQRTYTSSESPRLCGRKQAGWLTRYFPLAMKEATMNRPLAHFVTSRERCPPPLSRLKSPRIWNVHLSTDTTLEHGEIPATNRPAPDAFRTTYDDFIRWPNGLSQCPTSTSNRSSSSHLISLHSFRATRDSLFHPPANGATRKRMIGSEPGTRCGKIVIADTHSTLTTTLLTKMYTEHRTRRERDCDNTTHETFHIPHLQKKRWQVNPGQRRA